MADDQGGTPAAEAASLADEDGDPRPVGELEVFEVDDDRGPRDVPEHPGHLVPGGEIELPVEIDHRRPPMGDRNDEPAVPHVRRTRGPVHPCGGPYEGFGLGEGVAPAEKLVSYFTNRATSRADAVAKL